MAPPRRQVTRLALVGGHDVAQSAPPKRAPRASRRVLTTVLFTDVVDSTGHAVALGDEKPRVLSGLVILEDPVLDRVESEPAHAHMA